MIITIVIGFLISAPPLNFVLGQIRFIALRYLNVAPYVKQFVQLKAGKIGYTVILSLDIFLSFACFISLGSNRKRCSLRKNS